ncbi:TonB-dependent receptor [uncultured Draconibacterium sp.]|uniref:SusC/RagA family TonB-linked outer membrane protein n=1 Tax=uncultured Draconibacterium sp. TaxID=1573823 RepID=UPI0025CFBEE3|nr:TonB-dependent receptor [uncultured Draconibacterium sp.]
MRKHLTRSENPFLWSRSLLLCLFIILFTITSVTADNNSENIRNSAAETPQQKSISGTVTDEEGLPLPGATVIIKGTTNGIVTNTDGEFSLSGVNEGDVLLVSFVGFQSQEITIANQTTFNVALKVDAIGIEEIVTIGYGVQKKTTVTGAISTVKGEELAEIPVPNISQAMAGKLAGVSMRSSSGAQPGMDTPDLHIRGVVSTGNNSPLVVVDGVKRDNIMQIDPATIESITVLKDAAAVAPYGIGGANGVILITTKKGKAGKPVVRLTTSYGIQNPTYVPDMLDAADYMALQNEGYYNLTPNGTTPPNDADLIANYANLHKEDPYLYPDSKFIDVWNDNVPVQNHNIELSGGTNNLTYHAGLGYYNQKGLFDPVGYKRYNYNLSLELKATNTTKVGMSLYGSVEETNDLDPGENATGHLFRAFYKFVPIQQLIYPDGEHWGESSASTPVGALRSEGYEQWDKNTLLASVYLEQELPFIQGLSFKGVFSYDPTTQKQKQWHIPFVYHVIDLDANPYTFTEVVSTQEGNSPTYTYLRQQSNDWKNYTGQAYLNYARTFGDHSVTGLLVAEARKNTYETFWARRNNYALEIDELDFGSSDKLDYDNGGYSSEGSEIGFVYRLGYSYQDKYMLEAAGRYDGHYAFGPGKQWGYFPSFSAAWRVSEEDFMAGYGALNNLKLRASWGQSGNLPYIDGSLADFQFMPGYTLRGNAYLYGASGLVQGSRIEKEANPDITWEVSSKLDVGFDLNMYDGLLNVEFDFFHEKRTDMLLAPQVTLPVEYGLSIAQENAGEMKNNGFEITASSRKTFANGLELGISGNFSYAKNKMVEVFETDAQRANPNRTLTGRPYGTPFGYHALGLFTTDEDINGDGIINSDDGYNVTQFGDLHPGDIKYADLSGPDGVPDGIIDSNDETVIGDPVYPLMTYGLTADASWKGFDVSMFFQGTGMSSINIRQFMTVPFENNGSNTAYEYFDNRWTADNQNARYPRATPSPYGNNTKDSDWWTISSNYLRLKTMIVGYNLPKSFVDRIGLGGIRVSYTGQNLLTLSNIKHIDPEMGYDQRENSYPVMRSHTFGLDITF